MKGLDGAPDCRLAGLLELLFLAARDSAYLNETQKRVIERLLQEIVDVWTKKDFA